MTSLEAPAAAGAYLPAVQPAAVRERYGVSRVVQLASNENALGCSARAVAALRAYGDAAHRYPDSHAAGLRGVLGARFGVPPGWLRVGSGSDELIHLLCEAHLEPGAEALCSAFSFYRFREHAVRAGARVTLVAERGYRTDLRALARLMSGSTRMVYLANPNNPTGALIGARELEEFLVRASPACIVLLDEAYVEYGQREVGYPRSLPDWVRRFANLVVLRTFSKVYGLAGLRVGWCAAQPRLLEPLDALRLTYNVCGGALAAAAAALGDEEFVRRSVELVSEERPRLERSLAGLGLRVAASAANFLLIETPGPARSLFEALLTRGVVVRPLEAYGLPRHLRVSVGLPSDNAAFLEAAAGALGDISR